MAKKRSKDSPFPSRYSPGGWVTPAQYIIECVCENAAQHSNRDLPVRFWKNEEWQKFFVSQTRAVKRLLSKYSYSAILNVVKKKKLRSLIPKWIESVIEKEQKEIDFNKKKLFDEQPDKIIKSRRIISKPEVRKTFKTGSLNKLLALDEEIDNG